MPGSVRQSACYPAQRCWPLPVSSHCRLWIAWRGRIVAASDEAAAHSLNYPDKSLERARTSRSSLCRGAWVARALRQCVCNTAAAKISRQGPVVRSNRWDHQRDGRNASVLAVSSAKRGGGRVQDAAMLKLLAKSLLRQRPSGLAQSDVGRRESRRAQGVPPDLSWPASDDLPLIVTKADEEA